MLYSVCIEYGAVDCVVGSTGAYNLDIPSINHCAVSAQHAGCSMGASLHGPVRVYGGNHGVGFLRIMHIECTLVLIYASHSHDSHIGLH